VRRFSCRSVYSTVLPRTVEPSSVWRSVRTTPMDDYSSPLSETLRIGYLDTRRLGLFSLGPGTAPRACARSGKPGCTRGEPLEAALLRFPIKRTAPYTPKKGYTADETACPSDSRSWFPRLVPLTGFTLRSVLVFQEDRSDYGAASQLVSQPGFPGVLAHRLPFARHCL